MKIVIVNGSYRKTGSTAQILNEIYQVLKQYRDVEVQMIHVADMDLNYCVGCGTCYKTGACIYRDDVEDLSLRIAEADGIVLGSPTYASNVSGQMKVLIDRGHFVIEQLLYGKYAISVTTYENYGGKDAAKILNRLLSYAGAKISSRIVARSKFNSNPLEDIGFKRNIEKVVHKFYRDIVGRRKYILQGMKHFIVFRVGILPFVVSKGAQYAGVLKHWEKRNVVGGYK